MKNILLLIFILLISSVTLADLKYNPVQLDQFAMTNQCPDCDLSGAVLTYKMVKNHSQANLYRSNITPEQIQQATTVCDAILPDGTKGKCQ